MVIGSGKAAADLPLSMALGEGIPMTETQEFLLTGDCIVFFGFLLWIAYIVFCMPKNTFKKL
jgi:hypothetical protein